MHLGPFGCLSELGAKRAELVQNSSHEVALEFFATNAPDPPHLTLNCCFGAFCTIRVHSGPFGCLTKLGGKRAAQVQNFVPRNRVGVFLNKRTQSTQMDPKLTFWCVSYHLGAFGTIWLTRCKTNRTSAKVHATKSRRNFSHRMHPIQPIGP